MNQEPSGRCKIHPLVGKSDSQQAGHLARHASAESDFIFHLFFFYVWRRFLCGLYPLKFFFSFSTRLPEILVTGDMMRLYHEYYGPIPSNLMCLRS